MDNSPLAQHASLCDALDRLLTKGVVLHGDIKVSVAGVDLLYLGLRGLVCATDALESPDKHEEPDQTSSREAQVVI